MGQLFVIMQPVVKAKVIKAKVVKAKVVKVELELPARMELQCWQSSDHNQAHTSGESGAVACKVQREVK